MKSWILMVIMGALFSVSGVILALFAVATGTWVLLGGLLFLAMGLVLLWFVPAAQREASADGTEAPVVEGPTVPFEQVAALIRERLAGTPYVVDGQGSRIRVHADLADTEFLGLASAHKVKVVRGTEVVATKPGVAITRDFEQDLDLSLGVGRLTGQARIQSGRIWSYERRIEYGVGKDGAVGRQVDVRFSSSDIQDPVNAVLKETGWHAGFWGALPADGKVGLIMGAIGGGGAVVTAIVLITLALLGKFD